MEEGWPWGDSGLFLVFWVSQQYRFAVVGVFDLCMMSSTCGLVPWLLCGSYCDGFAIGLAVPRCQS